ATFLIGDGIQPSNESRGYVLRRLIRRAALHGRRLGLKTGTVAQLGALATRVMQAHYPELASQRERIAETLETEERKFDQTLSSAARSRSSSSALLFIRREAARWATAATSPPARAVRSSRTHRQPPRT